MGVVCQGFFIATSDGVGVVFRKDFRKLGWRGGWGAFSPFGEVPQAIWGFIRVHRFLSPPIPHFRLGLKVCLAGVVGGNVEVFITH